MSVLVVRLAAGSDVKWSNTTDSPVGAVMDRQQIKADLERSELLRPSAAADLLALVDAHGTSDPDVSVSEVIAANRAGPNEEALTLNEILDRYAS